MDTRLLKAFIAVAEELNFRKAAERLGVSQPPLTRMITQLEEELETKLFIRTTRHVELTGPGLHLWKRGQELMNGFMGLENEIRSLGQTRRRSLRLAFDFGALHSSLPRIISSFKEQFPQTNISVVEVKQTAIKQQLIQGQIDIYFGANLFQDNNFSRIQIQAQELGLLIPKESPLASQKKIQLKDLHGETLIFHGRHEHLGFQEEFLDLLINKNIKPRIYYKKNKESCGQLVISGKGLMLATKRSAHASPAAKFIPFADYSPKLKLYATWHNVASTLAIKSFLSFLETSSKVPSSELDGHLG